MNALKCKKISLMFSMNHIINKKFKFMGETQTYNQKQII